MSDDRTASADAIAPDASEALDPFDIFAALSLPVPEYETGDMGQALARAVTRGVRSDPEHPGNGFGTTWAD